MRGALAAALLSACGAAGAQASAPPPSPWAGPYQDLSQGPAPAWRLPPAPGRLIYWAFATGECGQERWGLHADAAEEAREMQRRIHEAVAEGRDHAISTGGEVGIFTCSTQAGMRRFVERHLSPRLVGLDFDIEGKQTPEQIHALVQQVAWAAQQWPHLRLSFTLATHASPDGRGLNATGEHVMRALATHGLRSRAVVNLMVMNYGPADARWCVLNAGRCDMAASAVQAAHNLHRAHGVPYAQIALTLMAGENDVAGNVTTPADAAAVAAAAKTLGLAGVHHWSLHRDQPCAAGSPRVSPRCHALPGVAPGRFGQALDAARLR